jgi:hypothetical protein
LNKKLCINSGKYGETAEINIGKTAEINIGKTAEIKINK